MKQNRFRLLFLCNLFVFTVGNGLLPLLPVYVRQLGATATEAGLYLALAYLALAAGTILAGLLVSRFGARRLFLASAAVSAVAPWLTAAATLPWQVGLLTAMTWFAGGIQAVLIHIQVGHHADQTSRGKTFSLMFLAVPLGALVGGLTIGRLVDWQGFPAMFRVLGVVYASLFPIMGYFALQEDTPAQASPTTTAAEKRPVHLGQAFKLLLLISFLFNVTIFIARLSTSLEMQTLRFSAGAVSSTMAAGGLVSIPFIFWFGSLSDRLGRRRFLAFNYVLGIAGVLLLISATQLWHFWLVSIFLSVSNYASASVSSALATDLLLKEAFNKGLSFLNASSWIAAVVGFSGAGFLMDTLGGTPLYFIAAALSLLALVLLPLLQGRTMGLPQVNLNTQALPRKQPNLPEV